ncbi:hypothetical protein ILUMI_20750 [Ignelater luminosus]|uniref:Uncharacterized protein n=1 Tax=Ignelater luminosus TaxID=2038154 RepID=A0A8K0FYL5_IGNLU|nr:hypothetical protein ILUMI_20750 [Ignelater luminosus]
MEKLSRGKIFSVTAQPHLLRELIEKLEQPERLQNGFKASGIFSLNPRVVLNRLRDRLFEFAKWKRWKNGSESIESSDVEMHYAEGFDSIGLLFEPRDNELDIEDPIVFIQPSMSQAHADVESELAEARTEKCKEASAEAPAVAGKEEKPAKNAYVVVECEGELYPC